MPRAPTPPVSSKPCRVCGENIQFAARKCIHCDSWQDWRGSIGIGSTALSMLVALVSVLVVGIPVFQNAFVPSGSKPKFLFLYSNEHHVYAFVSNEGRRAAVLRGLNVYIPRRPSYGRKMAVMGLLPHSESGLSAIVMAPGSGAVVRFDEERTTDMFFPERPEPTAVQPTCYVAFGYVNSDDQSKADSNALPCTQLGFFILAHTGSQGISVEFSMANPPASSTP